MFGLGMKVAMVVAVVAAAVVGVFYWQNQQLRRENAVLHENNGKLTVAVETQKAAVRAAVDNTDQWRSAMDGLQVRIDELADVQRESTAETRRLNGIWARHDLTNLARDKPSRIEGIINRGTAAALGVFGDITSRDIRGAAGPGGAAGATGPPASSPD